jgi:hypothetical protein
MNETGRKIAAATTSLLLAVPAWAAEEIQKSNGQKIVEGFLPLLIIFALLYFFLRRIYRRNGPYMDRAMAHMERLEKQNEEIIGLLKEMAAKKGPPDPPPLPPPGSSG